MAFSPISMSKVELFIQQEKLKDVSNLLYDLKLVQFFDLNQEHFEKFEHNDLNEISHELLQTRSAISLLKKYFKVNTANSSEDSIEKVLQLKNKLDDLEKKELSLKDELNRTKILLDLKVKTSDLGHEDLIVGFISSGKKSRLKKLTDNKIKYNSITVGKRIYFVCKTKKSINFEYKEFYLPKKVDENLQTKIEKTSTSIKKTKVDLRKLANDNLEHLRAKEHHLTKELNILEAKPNFVKTKNIVVISGHMPTNKVRTLRVELVRLLADKFELISSKATSDETPVKLNHSQSVGNFVELLKMYSMPKYNEIDPTFFMFLSFPIFFGFILGDVIYGIFSLIFFTILKAKMPKIREFCSILQLSAVSSIIFGIIYGEFIGYEIHGAFYGFFARSLEPTMLLAYAIGFGLLHINLGLILGFVNELSNKRFKKGICDKISFIVLQIGLGLLYYANTVNSSELTIAASVISIFAVALIYMGHGFIGIMEIPSFFTNILSYARLMAVGLSSVVIAMLINEFTHTFFSMGIGGMIGGVLLFTLGHIFNIALGNFEGFLHTLRLHYVEQMTKFYTGGGNEFSAFGERKIEQE